MQGPAQSLRVVPLQLCCALGGQLFLLQLTWDPQVVIHIPAVSHSLACGFNAVRQKGCLVLSKWTEIPFCVCMESIGKKNLHSYTKTFKGQLSAPSRIDTSSVWLLGGRQSTSKLSKLKTWGNMEYWFLILRFITKQHRIVWCFFVNTALVLAQGCQWNHYKTLSSR